MDISERLSNPSSVYIKDCIKTAACKFKNPNFFFKVNPFSCTCIFWLEELLEELNFLDNFFKPTL